MWKKFLALLAIWTLCIAAYAAVEVNKATEAELDSIKGVGPSTAAKIIKERGKGEFKDWADFEARVPGIKAKRAAKLSAAGLTVGGVSLSGAPAAAAAPAATDAAAPAAEPKAKKSRRKASDTPS